MKANAYKISDIPNSDRPRERMLQFGSEVLSNAELVAILLRSGTVSESAIHVAQRLLNECGDLQRLADMSVKEITQTKGIGNAKALQIKAAVELGRRLSKSRMQHKIAINAPEDAANYVMEDLRYLKKEHFVCLFLDIKHRIIAEETLSIGSLNASIVHPREIFKAAIQKSSAAIICVHNHPSGDPTPSPEDVEITHRLKDAGEILGIHVLDHIIIGDGQFYSLNAEGLL
ncbi:RadC family protein [Longirhabdus pacifica]|uniref:RadC family protein n=1 Tax=Longirhabdus pacifica TaxID=2305227 RepID=UPI0010086AFF|nr:DNA repair protein RadC [Longirhabdus pacifica]